MVIAKADGAIVTAYCTGMLFYVHCGRFNLHACLHGIGSQDHAYFSAIQPLLDIFSQDVLLLWILKGESGGSRVTQ